MAVAEPSEEPVVPPAHAVVVQEGQRRGLQQKSLERQASALPEKEQLQGLPHKNLRQRTVALPEKKQLQGLPRMDLRQQAAALPESPVAVPRKPETDARRPASQVPPAHGGGYGPGASQLAKTPTSSRWPQEGKHWRP
jgi:hypothetical protein